MNRRDMLKLGLLGTAGACAFDCSRERSIALTIIIGGSFLAVFEKDGSVSDVSLLLPDYEKECPIPFHRPILSLTKGTPVNLPASGTNPKSWSLLGLSLEPSVPGTLTARDYNVDAKEGDYPTKDTGWVSLKWLARLPDVTKDDENRLEKKRSAVLHLTGGTLEGYTPEFSYGRGVRWVRRPAAGATTPPAPSQALTDQIRLTATVRGSEIELMRSSLSGGELDSWRFAPDNGAVTLRIANSFMNQDLSAPDSRLPLQHFCAPYQIYEGPPPVRERLLPYESERFPSVDNADPASNVKILSPMGNADPAPLCDGGRVIRK